MLLERFCNEENEALIVLILAYGHICTLSSRERVKPPTKEKNY